MKKKLLILALILLSIGVKAQMKPFVGVSFHNRGYSLQGGGKYDNWVGLVGYSVPLTSAINPTLFFSNVGYEISLKEGFNITPLIGLSSFRYLYKESAAAWMGGVEIGKDINDGRFFINGNYCEGLFIGGGIKIFVN
jgi:hypothetical protein